MRSLARDLRYGFRGLLRSPGFTSVAVLTLALGVGAGSAIFSIMNGVMLNALPWKDPSTVVAFEVRKRGVDVDPRGATLAQYLDWKQQTHSFEDLYTSRWEQAYLTDRDEPRQAIAPRVTPNAFALLGIRALHGRNLSPQDALPGAPRVIMLTERLWQERYAGDPRVVGQSIELNGEPATVVGIQAAAQWYPFPQAEIVQPLEVSSAAQSRTDQRYGISGRLKRGVSLQQAQAEVDVIMARLGEQYPESDGELGTTLVLVRDRITSAAGRRGVYVLMGAVGFVLLIVCANLANLLLTRAAGREKEIATRAALGATRGQLVLQLLAECAAIGLLALPLALLVTRWSLDYFLSLVPDTVTFMDQFFRLDRNVLAFAVAITGLTVLLFGLSPALRASKLDLNASLKEGGNRGGTSGGTGRMRSALVVIQIGLALSLLVTSSLFMQALTKIYRVDPGFEVDGVMSAQVLLPEERYRDAAAVHDFYRRLEQASNGLPGNARAAIVSNAPLDWEGPLRDFQIAGRATADNQEAPRARWTSASAGYFDLLGLRVLAGRGLTSADRENGEPVAVVSQSLADQYFRGQRPVGQRIELSPLDGFGFVTRGTRQIVGVVADVKTFSGLRAPLVEPRIYEPLQQQPPNVFNVVVRSAADPLAAGPVLRERLRQLDPHLSLAQTQTMRTRLENRLWQANFFAKLMAILGGLALVLAAVGVFGVVSYATAKRTREFGIRAALGAEPRQIALLVLRKTVSLAGYGVALGLLLALLLERVTRTMLYETNGRDPATLLSISLLLVAITCAAAAVPTLRATRVNPMQSLREE